MSEGETHAPPRDPQELERLLIERQWEGDIDGMAALYEPDASPQREKSLLPAIRVRQ
jgi:hypothetical protein